MVTQPSKGLEQKVILSTVTDYQDWDGDDLRIPLMDDPDVEDFGDYSVRPHSATTTSTVVNSDSLGHLHQPAHFQDKVHPYIFNQDAGTGGRPGSSTRDLEFELDIQSITHSWNNQATQMDLWAGGTAQTATYQSNDTGEIVYQLNSYALDLGVFMEILAIRGILIDSEQPPHQSSAGAPHIRRQQLLDIARGQWAPIRGAGSVQDQNESKSSFMNPNKYLALTIGPVLNRTARDSSGNYLEDFWTGNEPHGNDIRGKERLRQANINVSGLTDVNADSAHKRALTFDPDYHPYWMARLDAEEGERVEEKDDWNVLRDWDYRLSYDGRSRYRGLISNLSINTRAGRPDVWDFNFQFVCVKNEMMYRTHY